MSPALFRLLAGLIATACALRAQLGAPTLTLRHRGDEAAPMLWAVDSSQGFGSIVTVAVGEQGTILTSTNGVDWVRRNSGTSAWLTAVANSGALWVAVGEGGTILRSSDRGQTWSRARNSGTTARLNGVIIQNSVGRSEDSRWIAVGEQGTIVVSADGDTWRSVPSGTTAWLRGIAHVNQLTVICGQGGIVLASTRWPAWDDWQHSPTPVTTDLEAVTLDTTSGRLVAVGAEGTVLVASGAFAAPPTGWTRNASGPRTAGRLRAILTGRAGAIAAGERGSLYQATSASDVWSELTAPGASDWNGLANTGRSLVLAGARETVADLDFPSANRIANVSTRAFVGTSDENGLYAGFVVRGAKPKRILLRGIGPSLASFGVASPLSRPLLRLYDAERRVLGGNDRWAASNPNAIAAASAALGAFALPENSLDAAMLVTLEPGAYSAVLTGNDLTPGIGLIEAYEVDEPASADTRLVNLSSRGFVGTGQSLMVPGIVITGADSRLLLVRAVGPGLVRFGVSGTLPDPWLRLVDARGSLVTFNDDWQTPWTSFSAEEVRTVSERRGAFALTNGARDAATLVRVPAGAYTVFVANSGDTQQTGLVLVEVYDVTGL